MSTRKSPQKPSEISWGMMTCSIVFLKSLPEEHLKGMFDSATMTIYISQAFSLETQQHTLWHEIKHFCWYVAGITPRLKRKKLEEDVITAQTASEIEVLYHHPEVRDFLFWGSEE